MRIFISNDATARDLARIVSAAENLAGDPSLVEISGSDGHMVVDISTVGHSIDPSAFRNMPGIELVDSAPLYRLASTAGTCDSPVEVRSIEIPFAETAFNTDNFIVMAGPCAVEDEPSMLEIARAAKNAGAKILRGGAFKPRTSPYSFQGLGEKGLEILAGVREKVGIAVITEAMDIETLLESPKSPTSSRSAPATCRISRFCAPPDFSRNRFS